MSNRCLKFVDTALAVSGKSHLPIYSCKYSKRKYTQHQLLTFILLKEDINVDCISIVELIELMDKLKSIMISTDKKVPVYAEAIWQKENGAFVYAHFRLKTIEDSD